MKAGLAKERRFVDGESTALLSLALPASLQTTQVIHPTENVSDPYTLSVQLAPVDDRLESEPNDSRADANALTPGTPITGYLDTQEDTDVYIITASAGSYNFLISGGPDVPFELAIGRRRVVALVPQRHD